jgi:hypothetical protein
VPGLRCNLFRQQRVLNQQHGHVFYESSQFRAGIHAPAVGKVDELHNLNLATAAGEDMSDHLKYFTELHRHEPGTLTRQARYLHRRTGGMIGSLSHLVRAAAQLAILEGDEAITRKLMDTIPVDHAAESGQHGAA